MDTEKSDTTSCLAFCKEQLFGLTFEHETQENQILRRALKIEEQRWRRSSSIFWYRRYRSVSYYRETRKWKVGKREVGGKNENLETRGTCTEDTIKEYRTKTYQKRHSITSQEERKMWNGYDRERAAWSLRRCRWFSTFSRWDVQTTKDIGKGRGLVEDIFRLRR